MNDQLLLLTPDAGISARSLARRTVDPASGVCITERCAETIPYLRALGEPVTAHQLSREMYPVHEWASPNTVARRLKDLEDMRLARRVGTVLGPLGRERDLWEPTS